MPRLRVLFLGAGKRLSLLERFVAAAQAEEVDLEMGAVELGPLVPIAGAARIHVGPDFTSPSFGGYLADLVIREGFDMVVPNMDSATVALARSAGRLRDLGAWAVVSAADLCEAMEDKLAARAWFGARSIPIPEDTAGPMVIAKRRHGFGSRGQFTAGGREAALARLGAEAEDYIVQPWVEGPEYTVDAYVGRDGRLLGALSRIRLEVVAGEVDLSETHREPAILEQTARVLAEPGWQGPITLQFIRSASGPVLIEVNPRFGGGVTHSIELGLDMPRWLLREQLGRPVEPVADWPDGSVMARCRRDVFLWR
jgi:carbamoyl-phosphate synthase large subunit